MVALYDYMIMTTKIKNYDIVIYHSFHVIVSGSHNIVIEILYTFTCVKLIKIIINVFHDVVNDIFSWE